MTRTEKRFVGDIGEEVAVRFLKTKEFSVVEQNYLKKWGEIDIVARKDSVLHFVEVKTIQSNVSRETLGYRPEENVDGRKLKRLNRAIESYLAEKSVSRETDWQIDVVTVKLDLENKKAKVGMLENVVL